VKTEGAFPTAWVYIDVVDRDIGSYVREAQKMVEQTVTLPPGYSLRNLSDFLTMPLFRTLLEISRILTGGLLSF